MARPLTHQALTLFAGLALLSSVVACAGGGAVPATPGANGSSPAVSVPGQPGVASASDNHGSEDCDGHKGHDASNHGGDDEQQCTTAPSATPTPGGGTTITVTTYQNIRPLALYAGGGVIDFLVSPVTTAGAFVPLTTGTQATDQYVVPLTCSATQPVAPADASRRSAAATASATPPPTPTPTNLPVSNCVIVAYANGANPVPVTGFGSIDGTNLIFAAKSPGLTYTIGVTYTFYVAIPTTTTVVVSPSPGPSATPSCSAKKDNGKHNGNDDTRNEDDHGNHKDCGYHTGDNDH